MAKFNFGKNKQTDEREQDEQLNNNNNNKNQSQDLDDLYYENTDDDFFDDAFDAVEFPDDEDDLESEAEQYAEDLNEDNQYKKAQPKWYEKVVNIAIVFGITTVLLVAGLVIFREPIRGFIGSSTEDIRDLDIQGEVEDYQEAVKDTLKGSEEGKEKEEEEDTPIKESDVVSDGEYLVGKDIQAGLWLAEDVLVDVYTNEETFNEQKNPASTNVKKVDIPHFFSLSSGQYVKVQGGDLVLNESRPETGVNVGDTFILEESGHVYVGKDIPEGFYTLYNSQLLEKDSKRRVKDAKLTVLNPSDEERSSIGIERKTTLFLRKGLMLEPSADIIGERVSADGTYGGDEELLNNMTQEQAELEEELEE